MSSKKLNLTNPLGARDTTLSESSPKFAAVTVTVAPPVYLIELKPAASFSMSYQSEPM